MFVSINDMLPIIKQKINDGSKVTINISGVSMQPLLYANRDTVTLSPIKNKLKRNDIPFYIRQDGTVILHRIIKVKGNDFFICRGDNQWESEEVARSQIIGVVCELKRNNRNIDVSKSIKYKLYSISWPFLHHFKFMYKYARKIFSWGKRQ